MIVRILLFVAILAVLYTCKPAVSALSTKGTIIKSEKDRVFVLFEEKFGKPGMFTGSWFYFPGRGIVKIEDYIIEVNLIKIR